MVGWQQSVQAWADNLMGQSLCIMTCGSHFGGAPCAHRVILETCEIGDDYFEFHFKEGEILTIVNPYKVQATVAALVVAACEFYSLGWHKPGMPASPESLCSIVYTDGRPGTIREEIPPNVRQYTVAIADALMLFPAPK